MEPAASIIARLGGEKAVSQITGRAYTAPYRWQQPIEKGGTGGLIPQRLHVILLAHARAHGVELSPTDFFPTHEQSFQRGARSDHGCKRRSRKSQPEAVS